MSEAAISRQWGVQFERIEVGQVSLRVARAGSGPLVILVHGFPESWYSWRHQIAALTSAGYQVAIPDVRGYGGSDKPEAVDAYDMHSLTADMAGLAQSISPDAPAIIIGHDWGAPIAWNSARLFPQLFRAVGGLSVPYVPPGDVVAIDIFRKVFTEKGLFFYMVYFQDEGVAEAELQADVSRSIRLFYTGGAADGPKDGWGHGKKHGETLFESAQELPMPRSWFSNDDLDYYASQFEQSGFRGPINRYRNFHRDSEFLKAQGDPILGMPTLFLTGDKDRVSSMYPSGPLAAMQPFVSDLRVSNVIDNCGHWTQQEQPEQVNQHLLEWLKMV
jgi:pimeloyl-ACP methyl ester carboxylesterase